MHIFVTKPDGRTLTIEMVKTDYIRELKEKIKDKTGHDINSQILKRDGQELDNGRKLEYYNIEEETRLVLSIFPTGAAGDDEYFQFFVIIPASNSQKTVTVRDLKRDSTSKDLKDKLKELEDIEQDRQELVFAGKVLRDQQTLGEQGLYNECSVFMSFRVPGGYL